jgi:hypothetical protein
MSMILCISKTLQTNQENTRYKKWEDQQTGF